MGYAATIIIAYGIRISSEDAAKIYEDCKEDFEGIGTMFYNKEDVLIEDGLYNNKRDRYYPDMYSEGTDSRVDSLKYDEGCSHVLGLYIASKGYAYNDEVEDYLTPNKMCTDNFNKYITPMLKALDIEVKEPKILITNQTW